MDWSMGGYGFYVWGSYLCAFVAIGVEILTLVKRKRACAPRIEGDRPNTSGLRGDKLSLESTVKEASEPTSQWNTVSTTSR